MAEWHAGRTVGRTLYAGDGPDDLIGIMDTRELAALVVVAVNEREGLQQRITRLERVRAAAAALWAKEALEDGAPPDTVTEWCELINALEACDG